MWHIAPPCSLGVAQQSCRRCHNLGGSDLTCGKMSESKRTKIPPQKPKFGKILETQNKFTMISLSTQVLCYHCSEISPWVKVRKGGGAKLQRNIFTFIRIAPLTKTCLAPFSCSLATGWKMHILLRAFRCSSGFSQPWGVYQSPWAPKRSYCIHFEKKTFEVGFLNLKCTHFKIIRGMGSCDIPRAQTPRSEKTSTVTTFDVSARECEW